MYHTLSPDPLTESLEYVKFVVAQQVQRRAASHLKTQTSALYQYPNRPLEGVLKTPVVLLDSCLDENPQLLHTLQVKQLASDHLDSDKPTLAPEVEELDSLDSQYSKACENSAAMLFKAIHDLSVMSQWEHHRIVTAALQAPETTILIAKTIGLHEFVYAYSPHTDDRVKKLEDVSDTQLYCVFFAFVDFAARTKPFYTYRWLRTSYSSLYYVAILAGSHLPRHGEPTPREVRLMNRWAGRCSHCDYAKQGSAESQWSNEDLLVRASRFFGNLYKCGCIDVLLAHRQTTSTPIASPHLRLVIISRHPHAHHDSPAGKAKLVSVWTPLHIGLTDSLPYLERVVLSAAAGCLKHLL
ncbi:hypothetical protein ONZ45_g11036 [Pleurotus djamor]|nr:hypothetical protein ONZ45_g11036 [Pleurotus djamor]